MAGPPVERAGAGDLHLKSEMSSVINLHNFQETGHSPPVPPTPVAHVLTSHFYDQWPRCSETTFSSTPFCRLNVSVRWLQPDYRIYSFDQDGLLETTSRKLWRNRREEDSTANQLEKMKKLKKLKKMKKMKKLKKMKKMKKLKKTEEAEDISKAGEEDEEDEEDEDVDHPCSRAGGAGASLTLHHNSHRETVRPLS
ncbi:unnamed protein product [Pleuronectes platessa]|uniref:Uncharacterized protein n=1 Tax=Pleuronectes platessa TaxID=8262 RepID=A0A9N7U718_PLEPL|nr:unnamed protein product [Pleuronectes platessa]